LMAWFGPAISQRAFEVGDEVRERFLARDGAAASFFTENTRGRWQADLYGLAGLQLKQAGLERHYGGGRCTFGETGAFFSYRRDGECGRMATFIFRMERGIGKWPAPRATISRRIPPPDDVIA